MCVHIILEQYNLTSTSSGTVNITTQHISFLSSLVLIQAVKVHALPATLCSAIFNACWAAAPCCTVRSEGNPLLLWELAQSIFHQLGPHLMSCCCAALCDISAVISATSLHPPVQPLSLVSCPLRRCQSIQPSILVWAFEHNNAHPTSLASDELHKVLSVRRKKKSNHKNRLLPFCKYDQCGVGGAGGSSWSQHLDLIVVCGFVIHHNSCNQAAVTWWKTKLSAPLRSFLIHSRPKLNIQLWEELITAYCKVHWLPKHTHTHIHAQHKEAEETLQNKGTKEEVYFSQFQ